MAEQNWILLETFLGYFPSIELQEEILAKAKEVRSRFKFGGVNPRHFEYPLSFLQQYFSDRVKTPE